MPLVRHHHCHCIDVVAFQHLTKITVAAATVVRTGVCFLGIVLIDFFAGRFTPQKLVRCFVAVATSIHVTDSNDLYVVVLQEPTHNPDPLVTRTDTGHMDSITGRSGAEYG